MKQYINLISLLLLGFFALSAHALDCVCVTTSCATCPLNVRSAPSTAGQILGSAFPNECMVSTDNCPGGWCEVEYEGSTAYVSADYVSGPQICGHPTTGNCFGDYCGTSSPEGRTCDYYGCGHYGAPRGSRDHSGSDVKCSANQAIKAPFDGYVLWFVPPYGDGTC